MNQPLALQITLWAFCAVTAVHAQNGGECSAGDIRLADGQFYYGQVEVCVSGEWGKLCANEFQDEEARVVCRELGLIGLTAELSETTVPVSISFGGGDISQPVALTGLECTGDELQLSECGAAGDGEDPACEAAGAICLLDFKPCCLITCGENSECSDGTSLMDSECICNEGFAINEDTGDCDAINVCLDEEGEDVCDNGECISDSEGGFVCDCDEGFAISEDGTKCEDVDECEEGYRCRRGRVCVNTEGSYSCRRTGTPRTRIRTRTTTTTTTTPGTNV